MTVQQITDDEMNCLYTKIAMSAEMIAEIEEFERIETQQGRELCKIIVEFWRKK